MNLPDTLTIVQMIGGLALFILTLFVRNNVQALEIRLSNRIAKLEGFLMGKEQE
jgi:uncharacterized YccA/Bax inhibitor family protein